MRMTWAPGVLKAVGLSVLETPGWQNRSHGEFPDSISEVWHHDATLAGDSPGGLTWMLNNWDEASANFRVDRYGVWECVGAGVSWHAGKIVNGTPGNFESFGVETDQTINETPSQAMLASVRVGSAALLKHMGRDSSSLWFHKIIARPPGRKVDPWFSTASNNAANWPSELASERAIVQGLIQGVVDLSSIVAPPASVPAPTPAPAPVPSAPFMLQRGSKGDAVKSLQQALGITADGDFGPATDAAVRAFQRLHGLVDDGVVGPATRAAMLSSAPGIPYPGALLRVGSTGLSVVQVQRRLGIVTDGDFGSKTKAAVIEFQRKHNLGPDGVVGPATWKVMFS